VKDWKKITRFVQLHQLYDYSLLNIILFSVIFRLFGPFHGFFLVSVIHGLFFLLKKVRYLWSFVFLVGNCEAFHCKVIHKAK